MGNLPPKLIWKGYFDIHFSPRYNYFTDSAPVVHHTAEVVKLLFIATPSISAEQKQQLLLKLDEQNFSNEEVEKLIYVLLMTGHAVISEIPPNMIAVVSEDVKSLFSPMSLQHCARIACRTSLVDNVFIGSQKLYVLPNAMRETLILSNDGYLLTRTEGSNFTVEVE